MNGICIDPISALECVWQADLYNENLNGNRLGLVVCPKFFEHRFLDGGMKNRYGWSSQSIITHGTNFGHWLHCQTQGEFAGGQRDNLYYEELVTSQGDDLSGSPA